MGVGVFDGDRVVVVVSGEVAFISGEAGFGVGAVFEVGVWVSGERVMGEGEGERDEYEGVGEGGGRGRPPGGTEG